MTRRLRRAPLFALAALSFTSAAAAPPAADRNVAVQESAVQPLALAWGALAEPEEADATTPQRLAEHLEFLFAHAWRPVRIAELSSGSSGERPVVLSFDDPASALLYALPLLELYQVPAVVTVDAAQSLDAALEPVLAALAASPWVELLPRVSVGAGAAAPAALACGDPGSDPGDRELKTLSALSRTLAGQLARLGALGERPTAVAWAPGTWSGPAEAVAASLGLTLHLPTFTAAPPALVGPRVARYAVPSWAGVWAIVQASIHWDPRNHPVRFVEVDAAWVCAGGDPTARIERILDVVRRLGLNGARIQPGDGKGAWFPTAAAPVLGDVVGPLVDALQEAGVHWVMVDLPPPTGDAGRDAALAADLARGADLDVAILPAGADPEGRLGETMRSLRPAVRLAGREVERVGERRGFVVEPYAPGQAHERGLTIEQVSVVAAERAAVSRAIEGWQWLGLPLELAELGLADSVRSLAAFALPK